MKVWTQFVPSEGGHASFTFAVASLVTHQLFRTYVAGSLLLSVVLFTHDTHSNRDDWTINDTSSYLDLSVVYGHNQATQDTVRDKFKGRGLLYPDAFAEERLLFLPPPS
jgi:linoleate 10R-lipoxygenase